MTKPPRITEAEWQVMEVLWKRSPLTANGVIERLASDWAGNTIRTLLTRLVRKGALKAEKDGGPLLYRPAFERDRHVAAESQSFLERIFFGSAKPALLHFVENSKLTAKDIEELKRCLEKGKR